MSSLIVGSCAMAAPDLPIRPRAMREMETWGAWRSGLLGDGIWELEMGLVGKGGK